jgi:hypothetical protein
VSLTFVGSRGRRVGRHRRARLGGPMIDELEGIRANHPSPFFSDFRVASAARGSGRNAQKKGSARGSPCSLSIIRWTEASSVVAGKLQHRRFGRVCGVPQRNQALSELTMKLGTTSRVCASLHPGPSNHAALRLLLRDLRELEWRTGGGRERGSDGGNERQRGERRNATECAPYRCLCPEP